MSEASQQATETAAATDGSTPTVLYCHCVHANVIPDEVKNATLREIVSRGMDFQAVPDLCSMAAKGDERLGTIAAQEHIAIAACHTRAVKGLFERAGYPLEIDGDQVRVLNMREHSADALADELPQPADSTAISDSEVDQRLAELEAAIAEDARADAGWKPWFPVIDTDRCTDCGLCSNFCIFGVYRFEDGKINVENPTNCKTDCPACARVCPETAIMFPKHAEDSPIAGNDDEPDGESAGVDMAGQMGGDVMGFLRGRSKKQRSRFARHAPDALKLCACAAESGMLSDLGIPDEVLAASAGDIQKAITDNPDLVQHAANAYMQVQSQRGGGN